MYVKMAIVFVISCLPLSSENYRPMWADDQQLMYYELLVAYHSIGIIEILIDDMQKHPDNIELDLLMMKSQIENIRSAIVKKE